MRVVPSLVLPFVPFFGYRVFFVCASSTLQSFARLEELGSRELEACGISGKMDRNGPITYEKFEMCAYVMM